jgi:hypothetical protein
VGREGADVGGRVPVLMGQRCAQQGRGG